MNLPCILTAAHRNPIGAIALASAGWLACLSAPALAGEVPAQTSAPAPAAAHVAAYWQKHQYSLQYMGFTTTYSCDGLADKLKVLLLAAGARADAKSQPGACAAGYGRPDKFARADLTFYTLQPMDAGAVKDLGAADNVQAGNTPAPAAAQAKPVDAIWRPVAFAAFSPREIRVGDCELVEQFHHDVLPLFAAREVQSNTTCVPHQESGSVINLKFEALAAAPPAGGAQPR